MPQTSRVLVVEDDALVRRAYERVLAPDHEVTSVGTGVEALAVLGGAPFGAVVSDIDVPGLTGIELLKAVRSADSSLPIVLVTGCPSVESAQDAVNFGAFGYLTKPVEPTALREMVTRALGARSRPANDLPHHETMPLHRTKVDASLESRLANALDTMYMAFQPIVSYGERRVLGYEALLRTEEKSLVRPPDMLDAAEKLGRLDELGRRARRKVAEAIPRAPKDARFFINLHARDLRDPELLDPKGPMAPFADRVVLEVTERASIEEVDDLSERVSALRAMGFWLAIDDLGAGYAGLTSLTRLEPEVVKLDMSLVRDVDTNHTKQQLIRSVVGVCRDLSMLVVTEGVETTSERDTLVELGCDVFQGYLFGRPQKEFVLPTF